MGLLQLKWNHGRMEVVKSNRLWLAIRVALNWLHMAFLDVQLARSLLAKRLQNSHLMQFTVQATVYYAMAVIFLVLIRYPPHSCNGTQFAQALTAAWQYNCEFLSLETTFGLNLYIFLKTRMGRQGNGSWSSNESMSVRLFIRFTLFGGQITQEAGSSPKFVNITR